MRFQDDKNRPWVLSLDIGAAMRVKSMVGVDFLGAGWSESVQKPEVAVNVAYSILQPVADARGITDWKFGRGLRGDSFPLMADALSESVAAFFPPLDMHQQLPGAPPLRESSSGPVTWDSLFQTAGVVGVDPRPFTLRQLLFMAKGAAARLGVNV